MGKGTWDIVQVMTEYYELGPLPCFFCGEGIVTGRIDIHHVNGDHADNSKGNRKFCHASCHGRYHRSLQPRNNGGGGGYYSPEARAKISAANKGKTVSPETRQKMRDAALRRHGASEETIQVMRDIFLPKGSDE